MLYKQYLLIALLGCLYAGSGAIAAEVIIRDGVATRILNVEINGTLYDVAFVYGESGVAEQYAGEEIQEIFPFFSWSTTSEYDFNTDVIGSDTHQAADAINAVLTYAGVDRVGARGMAGQSYYYLPWGVRNSEYSLSQEILVLVRGAQLNQSDDWGSPLHQETCYALGCKRLFAILRPAGDPFYDVLKAADGVTAQAIKSFAFRGKLYDVTFEYDSIDDLNAAGALPAFDDQVASDELIEALREGLSWTLTEEVRSPEGERQGEYFYMPTVLNSGTGQVSRRTIQRINSGQNYWWVPSSVPEVSTQYDNFYAALTRIPIVVQTDLDPWGSPDAVRPSTNNSIYLAILGGGATVAEEGVAFDVTQIDPASLAFGPDAAPNIANMPLLGDYDNDGITDAAVAFQTQATGIRCDESTAQLKGQTLDGDPFIADVSFVTTDCMKDAGFFTQAYSTSGGGSIEMAYDYTLCYESVYGGGVGTVSMDLTESSSPDCDFLKDQEGSIYAEATLESPVFSDYSITLSNSVYVNHTSPYYFVLFGPLSSSSVHFTLPAEVEVELKVVKTGHGGKSVQILTGTPPIAQHFDEGTSVVTLPAGNYSLHATVSQSMGSVDSTTSLDVELSVVPLQVEVDVDPWSAANVVRPDSNDSVTVAIMGSDPVSGDATNFDVDAIDPASLRLGPGGAQNIALNPLPGDYDSDGNQDAAFAFSVPNTGIACDDPNVSLTGTTTDGLLFAGTSPIDTIECESGGCHP